MSARLVISKPLMTALGLAVGSSLLMPKNFAAAPQDAATPTRAAVAQSEWLTWGYDQERTLWNRAETVLNKDNVGQLALKWKTQMPTPVREVVLATLTTPSVVTVNGTQGPVTRVFVVGSDNTVYAVDAETGSISWRR